MRPWWKRFATALIFCFAAATSCAAGAEIVHDFRSATFDYKRFRYEGPNAAKFINPEADGLHWKFSPGHVPDRPVGVYWNSPLQGDFVAIVKYQITEIAPPSKGNGVGAELYLMLDGPGKDGITLSRVELPDGQPVVKFLHLATDATSGKRFSTASRNALTGSGSLRGRLCLARTGTTLMASWSEGENLDFRELQRTEVPATDVRMARFAGVSGSAPDAVLDMRLLEYRLGAPSSRALQVVTMPAPPLTAEKVTDQPTAEPNATTAIPPRSAPYNATRFQQPLVIGGVASLAVALLLWLWSKRRSIKGSPAQASSPAPASATKIEFVCQSCGKRLKVGTNQMGRSVKCPACGTLVPVPE